MVFGRRVEIEFGVMNFLAFLFELRDHSVLGARIAESDSLIPLIGASGAISGVLGAFLMANPRARITLVLDPTLIYFLRRLTVRLPAWIFLLGWFLLQLGFALKPQASNIAFWAHVGGFLSGVVITVAVYKHIPRNIPYSST